MINKRKTITKKQETKKTAVAKNNVIVKTTETKPNFIKTKNDKYIWATGKRKTAIAQIRFSPDSLGKSIIINKKELKEYFPYSTWQKIVCSPLEITGLKNYKIIVKVKGGGIRAQAESIRLGISRALVKFNQELRKILKPMGFLKRDSRIKERKKPGLKRARRAPQWQKR